MIPYETLSYFFMLGILFIPTIVFGLRGKKISLYNNLVGLILIILIFFKSIPQLSWLFGFIIWQTMLALFYIRYRRDQNRSDVFYLLVILSIVPLIITKLQPVFMPDSVIGFLGISYVTFKAIQVIIEIRDGLIKELGLYSYIRFLLFFPTFTSGPIDRYRRFEKDQNPVYEPGEYKELLYLGMNRIFQGFLYKFIIAHTINLYVINNVWLQGDTLGYILIYMYGYSLFLFFDFAGYSAFAIGLSYMLGIRTPENFNKPFISRNIKDFWNRWHMSLSFWFRDYVYMRLVFFITKKKWIKNRFTISYISYFALFLLMGIWHGLQWNYIVYGLYHAVLITCYDWFDRKNKKKKWIPRTKWTNVLSIVITFHFICFGLLIFSGRLF